MDDPVVYVGAGLLILVAGFALGRLSSRIDRRMDAEERHEQQQIARRLESVEATRKTFEARASALMAMMDGDSAAMSKALDTIQEHSGLELLRYYGSADLIRRWWAVQLRIEGTYMGTDRAKEGPPEAAWLEELREVRGQVLAALRTARDTVAEGGPVGEELVNNPDLSREYEQHRERDRANLQRAIDLDTQRRSG